MFADTRWAGRTWPETAVKSHPQDSSFVCFLLFLHIYFFIFLEEVRISGVVGD